MTTILDGKVASAAYKQVITEEVSQLVAKGKRPPHLAAILVGNDGASETYVASKEKELRASGL